MPWGARKAVGRKPAVVISRAAPMFVQYFLSTDSMIKSYRARNIASTGGADAKSLLGSSRLAMR
jgi:hypothetical protein